MVRKLWIKLYWKNIFDRDRPIDPSGPIHLQAISGEVCYRNIIIRELSDEESNKFLSERSADKRSFKPLFNGQDLSGWAGAVDNYAVVDGNLQSKRLEASRIKTVGKFSDYILRFEFQLPPGANSGILVHAPNPDAGRAKNVLEIQILDDSHTMHRSLAAAQYHGSVYGIAASKPRVPATFRAMELSGNNC